MVNHHVSFYNFYPLVITKLSYNLSYLFAVLPINCFSPILWSEHNMVSTQPLRMCQILFFCHKKHLFDYGRELEQLRLTEKVFFMFNFLVFHPLSGWFVVSLASLSQLPKGVNTERLLRVKEPFCTENLGIGLLSHARIRSIMGDEALNFRVRNGFGCTRFSMDTKEIFKIYN